jgi:hypothetical protein
MDVKAIAYFTLLLLVSVLGIVKWKSLNLAEKYMAILMPVTLVTEWLAFLIIKNSGNSLPVYHVFNPVEFLLISLYFNQSIEAFKRKNIGLYVGVAGMLIGLMNTLLFQKPTTINSYFLLFEGTVVIIFCLLSFHQILLDEEHLPYGFAHFWITICFMVFYSTTFTGWGIYTILDPKERVINSIFHNVLATVNFIFYTGIAAIFINYKKLTPSGA